MQNKHYQDQLDFMLKSRKFLNERPMLKTIKEKVEKRAGQFTQAETIMIESILKDHRDAEGRTRAASNARGIEKMIERER